MLPSPLAQRLADDRDALRELRNDLRPQMLSSSLCDPARFTRDFEAALENMWRQRQHVG